MTYSNSGFFSRASCFSNNTDYDVSALWLKLPFLGCGARASDEFSAAVGADVVEVECAGSAPGAFVLADVGLVLIAEGLVAFLAVVAVLHVLGMGVGGALVFAHLCVYLAVSVRLLVGIRISYCYSSILTIHFDQHSVFDSGCSAI